MMQCLSNVQDTLTLLRDLGFCPNLDKSVVQPTHLLKHLGFIFNSLDMSVSITDCNFRKFLDTADKILQCRIIPIRLVARLVGIMVSFFPGVEYARLFYRQLEIKKSIAPKILAGILKVISHYLTQLRMTLSGGFTMPNF